MISIVMPVYNTGKYLEESLQSILTQSFTDFELICVDDGSDDELTKQILYKYENEDRRIKVLSMENNVGAAEARNIGLANATGKYITFLDGDDIFHKDMLMNAYITIEKYDADMCIWGYRVFRIVEGKKKVLCERSPIRLRDRAEGVFKLTDLPENGLNLWTSAPWTKLCKRSFIADNKIKFQNLKCANDVFYSMMCAICAERIVYVEGNQILVDYRTGSGNQISSNRDPRCVCDAVEEIMKTVQSDKCLSKKIAYAFFDMLRYEFRHSDNKFWREESYYRIRKILKRYFENVTFENNTWNVLREKVENFEYNYGQIFLNADLEAQLQDTQEDLKKEIGESDELVVWGYGKRGKAFLNILDITKYKKVMVVDRSNDGVDLIADKGVPIIHTDMVMGKECVIVATNTSIYNDIKELDDFKHAKIINLEKYCPVG